MCKIDHKQRWYINDQTSHQQHTSHFNYTTTPSYVLHLFYVTSTAHHHQLLIIVISNSCRTEMGRLASVALAVSLLLVIHSDLGSCQRDGIFSFLTSFRRPARVRKPQPIIVRASRVHKVGDIKFCDDLGSRQLICFRELTKLLGFLTQTVWEQLQDQPLLQRSWTMMISKCYLLLQTMSLSFQTRS